MECEPHGSHSVFRDLATSPHVIGQRTDLPGVPLMLLADGFPVEMYSRRTPEFLEYQKEEVGL